MSVIRELFVEGGNLSFWEINPTDDSGITRVLGAYAGAQGSLSSVTMRYLDSSRLVDLGIEFRKTTPAKGSCPDIGLGAVAHYDLKILETGPALRLAAAMAAGDVIEFPCNKVADALTESLRLGHFKWGDLKDKLVFALLKDHPGNISITAA